VSGECECECECECENECEWVLSKVETHRVVSEEAFFRSLNRQEVGEGEGGSGGEGPEGSGGGGVVVVGGWVGGGGMGEVAGVSQVFLGHFAMVSACVCAVSTSSFWKLIGF
jgi:hypothetical protein